MELHNHIPIYQRLTDYYRKEIITQNLKAGSKIDSINKIMSRHNVSRETAKRVLKGLMDEKLVISQPGKGTFINSTAELNDIWGMVIPFYSSNIEQLIIHLHHQAKLNNHRLEYYLHYNNPDEEMNLIGKLIQRGYKAIIVVPNHDESSTGSFYRHLIPGNTKIILADNTMSGSYFNCAIQSYDLGVKRAIDYITSKHSGNYLLINNENWQGKNLVFELMKQTFDLIIEAKHPNLKLFHVSDINELTADFFHQNNIRGVLSIQDSISIRLISRLKAWGFSIPEDLTVVSYGNTELTKIFSPAITVVDCKYEEMASNIAHLIKYDLDRKSRQIIIQPELIVRET